jgi:hypothetical protein
MTQVAIVVVLRPRQGTWSGRVDEESLGQCAGPHRNMNPNCSKSTAIVGYLYSALLQRR